MRWVVSFALALLVHGGLVLALVSARGESRREPPPERLLVLRWVELGEEPAPAPPRAAAPEPSRRSASVRRARVAPAHASVSLPEPVAEEAATSTAPPIAAPPPVRIEGTGEGAPATALPRLRARVKPRYPSASRLRGDQGTALLRVEIAESGAVRTANVERSSGHSELDDAALDAVKRWRFEPEPREPHPVAVFVPIEFRLR